MHQIKHNKNRIDAFRPLFNLFPFLFFFLQIEPSQSESIVSNFGLNRHTDGTGVETAEYLRLSSLSPLSLKWELELLQNAEMTHLAPAQHAKND